MVLAGLVPLVIQARHAPWPSRVLELRAKLTMIAILTTTATITTITSTALLLLPFRQLLLSGPRRLPHPEEEVAWSRAPAALRSASAMQASACMSRAAVGGFGVQAFGLAVQG